MIRQLPTDFQYSKFDKDNPFALYCSYLDYVRPVELQEKEDFAKEEMENLELKIQAMEVELTSC